MTIGIRTPPIWMERSGKSHSCICPECGTICRTINPTGNSAEIYCTECCNAFRITFGRMVVEEEKA